MRTKSFWIKSKKKSRKKMTTRFWKSKMKETFTSILEISIKMKSWTRKNWKKMILLIIYSIKTIMSKILKSKTRKPEEFIYQDTSKTKEVSLSMKWRSNKTKKIYREMKLFTKNTLTNKINFKLKRTNFLFRIKKMKQFKSKNSWFNRWKKKRKKKKRIENWIDNMLKKLFKILKNSSNILIM